MPEDKAKLLLTGLVFECRILFLSSWIFLEIHNKFNKKLFLRCYCQKILIFFLEARSYYVAPKWTNSNYRFRLRTVTMNLDYQLFTFLIEKKNAIVILTFWPSWMISHKGKCTKTGFGCNFWAEEWHSQRCGGRTREGNACSRQ